VIVVADTTPLLTLFKIGRVGVLNKLYNSVHIPFAVFEELTRNTEYPEEAEYFRNCPFLEVHSELSAERVSLLQRATGLDLGESEAIILADEKQPSLLLIDESKGRVVAESMKLTITGSIGILFAAYQKKLLTADEIDQSVTMLRGMNRFIGEKLFNLLLSLVHGKK
jgi:predicted nucleic acid-binding protein